MPPSILAILFVIVCCSVSLAGLAAVRRLSTIRQLDTHHEVAGFLVGIVGVIYAVLLAFVVVIVWERYHEASRNLAQEANQVGDLWQLAKGFRPELRDAVRPRLTEYAAAVTGTEFLTMPHEQPSPEAAAAFARVWDTYVQSEPRSETERVIYGESLATLNLLSDCRRMRLHDAEDHMPGLVWATLFGGAAITVAFMSLFQLKSYPVQILMTVAVVAMIALTLFLVIALSRPFGRILPLSDAPFRQQLARMGA